MTIMIARAVLILDADIQPRETMASGTIKEYTKLYCEGQTLPPIVVFQEGSDYWLADGFHRVEAAKQAFIDELPAEVNQGTKRDAILYACGCNKHGKIRTNEDKRRVVERMLHDPEWQRWSNNSIADHCGVSHDLVNRLRKSLDDSSSDKKQNRTYQDRWGNTHDMQTSAIGRRDPEPMPLVAASPADVIRASLREVDIPEEIITEVLQEEGYEAEEDVEDVEDVEEETTDDISRNDIETAYPSRPAPPLILIPDPPPVVNGQRPTFNHTNEMVDWAKWTWNPVTGCLHNCVYCYARDIAERFYPEKFVPTFRPERLKAPHYTKVPPEADEQIGFRNVFVCSMADLFGKWVPQEWIDAVLEEVRAAPQWNFLFLTKFPQRLAEIDWPQNAWVGTTVDEQYRVDIAERAFRKIQASVKWLSCEPLREQLTFSSLDMFDWVVVGGQSKSSQAPAFQPPWAWIEHLWQQARTADCLMYWKPNLETRPQEYPGQKTTCVTPSSLMKEPAP